MGSSLASTGPGGSASPKAAERGGFRSAGEGQVRAQSGLVAGGGPPTASGPELHSGSAALHAPRSTRPATSQRCWAAAACAGHTPRGAGSSCRHLCGDRARPAPASSCPQLIPYQSPGLPATSSCPGLPRSLGPDRTGPGSHGHTRSPLLPGQTRADPLLSACLRLWRPGQGTLLSTALALSTKRKSNERSGIKQKQKRASC